MKENPRFTKNMKKWLICCAMLLGSFLLLGTLGVLLSMGGCYCVLKFM